MVSFDEKKPPSGIFNRIPRKQRWKTYNIWIPFFSLSFCDLWSPEDLTSLWLIILCGGNTLGIGVKEGLIDLPFEQGFCVTFYILMMDVWHAALLVFQHCTSFGFPTLPFPPALWKSPCAGTCACRQRPSPKYSQAARHCLGAARGVRQWFSWWKEMAVHVLPQIAFLSFVLSLGPPNPGRFSLQICPGGRGQKSPCSWREGMQTGLQCQMEPDDCNHWQLQIGN